MVNPEPVMVELFSGKATMAKTFKKHGFRVLTIDINQEFEPDVTTDIAGLTLQEIPEEFRHPSVVWASVPCTHFSVARIGYNWRDEAGIPIARSVKGAKAAFLVWKTLCLIDEFKPEYWFIENPVGKLRKMPFMKVLPRKTVTYCQYGLPYRKPTDIFTNCLSWISRPMCSNGDACHEASPRGTSTGIQALSKAKDRAIIPDDLAEEIVRACMNGSVKQKKLFAEAVHGD